ncbi:MAG: hypothetical protein ACRD12_04595 [Acidimicrobiales bacterium]
MKRFLCTSRPSPDRIAVQLADRPEGALNTFGGRASPLFPASPEASVELPGACTIAFLVPACANSLLARLLNDYDAAIAARTFVTHGLASVVLVAEDAPALKTLLEELQAEIRAYELWSVVDGIVKVADIELRVPVVPPDPWCEPVTDSDLDFGMAAQVRQFNSNIAYLAAHASRYAPEYRPLIDWLHDSVAKLAQDHARLSEREGLDDDEIRRLIGLETLLIELNAVLTLFISQAVNGSIPIHEGSYPVGEYSLLGVGGMVRALWRLYHHLNSVFAEFDHAGRIRARYQGIAPFDPFAPATRTDYSAWIASGASVGRIEGEAGGSTRVHLPHFSSRWGFHESFYGLSVSWQCIHAGATKEWNLLTITHEFLHSHVRDLLGVILDVADQGGIQSLVERYNSRERGQNALESMQVAIVEALVGIRGAGRLSRKLARRPSHADAEVPQDLAVEDVVDLMRAHGGFIHELVVHVLDFLYIYNGRDEQYVNSIWSSWALVPIVNDRIEHYVLRTLCTLSITSQASSPDEIYSDTVQRMEQLLVPLQGRERTRPAIDSALAVLRDPTWVRRLGVEFRAARYVVKLAELFFFDGQLNAALVRDSGTTVHELGRTYALSVGEFRGEAIESPVGLLLDRFGGYRDQAAEDVEYESIWQMLILV